MPTDPISAVIAANDALPNADAPVATAVPAFIGYTPRADLHGVSCICMPVRIRSFEEFAAYFLLPSAPAPADPVRQYRPQYYLVSQTSVPAVGASLRIGGTVYAVLPDPATLHHLYNSVRLFYLNGGGEAWIVSVGVYGPASGKPLTAPDAPTINPNIVLADLLRGLERLKQVQEPTLYLCPDAILLSAQDNATLMQAMLAQAQAMRTAVCLFDVINADRPTPDRYPQDIAAFRSATGDTGLDFGIAYYPFIGTSLMNDELDFRNLFGGDLEPLAALIDPPAHRPSAETMRLDEIREALRSGRPVESTADAALRSISPIYAEILRQVQSLAGLLPPSGAMAGVYATNDAEAGVWQAPANVGIVGADSLPIELTDSQQAPLNVDAITGKSINAIRFFNGQGILVWGARTLDGNSEDWRYLAVRRAAIFLEQSMKRIACAHAFSPNDANTWSAVQAAIVAFLTEVWKRGGLQGATPADAFRVTVGLGETMTSDDLLDGVMRVTALVALTHPAEFIVITFEQQTTATG
ncbi:MAG: phage tail sheath family protein [Pseudomonadota bacterium]